MERRYHRVEGVSTGSGRFVNPDNYVRRWTRLVCSLGLGSMILGISLTLAVSPESLLPCTAPTAGSEGDCSDSLKGCKPKVKFISKTGSCYTFACESGTKNEHLIHIKNDDDVRKAFQMAEESEPKQRNLQPPLSRE